MKTPLVLLHGWGVNSLIWNSLLPQLSSEFEVHLLDLPGYGNDVNYDGPYELETVVDRILQAAPPTAVWSAWSLGATIALWAAQRFPDRFLKLQLVSATPRFMVDPSPSGDSPTVANWDLGMHPEPLDRLKQQFDKGYAKGLKKFLLLQNSHLTNARELVRQRSQTVLKLPPPTPSTLTKSLELLTHTDLRNELEDVNVATCVVAGRQDVIVPPAASRWLADRLPNASFVELNAGHLPFLDEQEPFVNTLKSFAGVA